MNQTYLFETTIFVAVLILLGIAVAAMIGKRPKNSSHDNDPIPSELPLEEPFVLETPEDDKDKVYFDNLKNQKLRQIDPVRNLSIKFTSPFIKKALVGTDHESAAYHFTVTLQRPDSKDECDYFVKLSVFVLRNFRQRDGKKWQSSSEARIENICLGGNSWDANVITAVQELKKILIDLNIDEINAQIPLIYYRDFAELGFSVDRHEPRTIHILHNDVGIRLIDVCCRLWQKNTENEGLQLLNQQHGLRTHVKVFQTDPMLDSKLVDEIVEMFENPQNVPFDFLAGHRIVPADPQNPNGLLQCEPYSSDFRLHLTDSCDRKYSKILSRWMEAGVAGRSPVNFETDSFGILIYQTDAALSQVYDCWYYGALYPQFSTPVSIDLQTNGLYSRRQVDEQFKHPLIFDNRDFTSVVFNGIVSHRNDYWTEKADQILVEQRNKIGLAFNAKNLETFLNKETSSQ